MANNKKKNNNSKKKTSKNTKKKTVKKSQNKNVSNKVKKQVGTPKESQIVKKETVNTKGKNQTKVNTSKKNKTNSANQPVKTKKNTSKIITPTNNNQHQTNLSTPNQQKSTKNKKVSKAKTIARTKKSTFIANLKKLQRKIRIYGIFSVIPKHAMAVIACGIIILFTMIWGIYKLITPHYEPLDLDIIASEIDQLKTVKFDINQVENIIANSKAYNVAQLKDYYEYDYEKFNLKKGLTEELVIKYNEKNKQLFIAAKLIEGQEELFKTNLNNFLQENNINAYTTIYDGYYFYINSSNNLAVMSKVKQTQVRVFDIMQEYKKNDIEKKFKINSNWYKECMIKHSIISDDTTGYIIIHPKNKKSATKIKKAMDDYYNQLNNKWTKEGNTTNKFLVDNRYATTYNGYLVYIVSRNNDLVMELIKK